MRAPIVAVVYAEATAPVVQAQTPPLLDALGRAGRAVDVAVFTSPRRLYNPFERARHGRALRRLAKATGRDPIRLTHFPRDRFLGWMGRRLANALEGYKAQNAVLLCRQPRAAIIGAAARKVLKKRGHDASVVLDLRGLRPEEYLLTLGREESVLGPKERKRLEAYRKQEARGCEEADAVLCVSGPMLKHVRDRYEVDPQRLEFIPNHAPVVAHAERLRAEARTDMGFSHDTLVVAYVGTLAAWQMPVPSVMLVKALAEHFPGTRLLFLTPDVTDARQTVKQVGLQGAVVKSVAQPDVARLLAAADYGLLLRESSPVNRVACPVKFGEYLASGVRLLASPGIGDVSDLVTEFDLGIVVSPSNLGNTAQRIALDARRPNSVDADGRARIRDWARRNISPDRAAEVLLGFVESVLGR